MAHTFAELESLRKKLDQKRRDLDEQERALAKVEQMLREEMEAQAHEPPQLPIYAQAPISTGFVEAVRIAVTALGNTEFTVHDVENYLEAQGFDMPKVDPRSRIAMVFQSMRNKGLIVCTLEGKGRTPSQYRVKKDLPKQNEAHGVSSTVGFFSNLSGGKPGHRPQ